MKESKACFVMSMSIVKVMSIVKKKKSKQFCKLVSKTGKGQKDQTGISQLESKSENQTKFKTRKNHRIIQTG